MMRRKIIKDFTFSNGITVPAGTHIAVATNSTHMDQVRDPFWSLTIYSSPVKQNNYDSPNEFRGFRFAERREKEGEGKMHQMVSLSLDYGTFGTGRHAW